MKARLASIVAAILGAGCGGGSGGEPEATLTCAWLQGENCWTQLLAGLSQCVDPGMGALAADRTSCSYASGTTATFSTAVPIGATDYDWDFEVRSGSSLCAGLHEVGQGFTVESSGGTFGYETIGSSGLRITCPDGSHFETSDGFTLLGTCGTRGYPGRIFASDAASVHYWLAVEGDGARTVQLVNCRVP